MNNNANKIGLQYTQFDSPHGLSNPLNYSNAYDVALMTAHVMETYPELEEITSCAKYEIDVTIPDAVREEPK
jgi:D-alanyl-D-alanine carboxypeptidase